VEIFYHPQGVIERCAYLWSENRFSGKTAGGSEGAGGLLVTHIYYKLSLVTIAGFQRL
jgi:hypothetical protein